MEDLRYSPVVAQPDALSARYKALYGSSTALGYSPSANGPEEVYNTLAPMINAGSETCGYDVVEALEPAA